MIRNLEEIKISWSPRTQEALVLVRSTARKMLILVRSMARKIGIWDSSTMEEDIQHNTTKPVSLRNISFIPASISKIYPHVFFSLSSSATIS